MPMLAVSDDEAHLIAIALRAAADPSQGTVVADVEDRMRRIADYVERAAGIQAIAPTGPVDRAEAAREA